MSVFQAIFKWNLSRVVCLVLALGGLTVPAVSAAPAAELWARWATHRPEATEKIDHALWDKFLASYVRLGADGITRVNYRGVTAGDRGLLLNYLQKLQGTAISQFNQQEQLAFWINLYNALTVKVVLDHYPVESIREVDISGFFSNGPWDAQVAQVEGEKLSLNDIEHRILRPIWKDARLHYALNCASLGCPNLQLKAYTPTNAEALLEQAARDFINHPRGAAVIDGQLRVASIFVWYQEDFGASDEGLIAHLRKYAKGQLAAQLASYRGDLADDYDWRLNDAESTKN